MDSVCIQRHQRAAESHDALSGIKETKELFAGFGARYVPTGHIIYMAPNNNELLAIPFDAQKRETAGEPIAVLKGVTQYAVSESGTLAYIPGASGGAAPRQTFVWMNRDGKEEALSTPPNEYWAFALSPDGKRVALTVMVGRKRHIGIWDMVRETMTRLTIDEGTNTDPLWSPNGERIVYSSSPDNTWLSDLYWKAADGPGEAEKLATVPGRGLFPRSWSGDGKNVVVWEIAWSPLTPSKSDIGLFSMEGNHVRNPLLQQEYHETSPRVSHDGRWIAYASNESGNSEVYVRSFPDVNTAKCQISTTRNEPSMVTK